MKTKTATVPRLDTIKVRLGVTITLVAFGALLLVSAMARGESATAPKSILPIVSLSDGEATPATSDLYETANLQNPANDLQDLLSSVEPNPTPEQVIEKEFYSQLRKSLPGRGEGATFGNLRMPMNLDLPEGEWNVRFEFRLPQRGIGTVLGTGTIFQAGRPVQRVTASVLLDREALGLQVRRVVRRGERIRPEDVILMQTSLSQLPSDAVSDFSPALGAAARSEIRPGMWVTGRMLVTPIAVKTRHAVTIRLVDGPIEIVTKGIAKQNGAIGEVIRVENMRSKREVLARVINRDEVQVIF